MKNSLRAGARLFAGRRLPRHALEDFRCSGYCSAEYFSQRGLLMASRYKVACKRQSFKV